jgi:hypothetical protein
VTVCELTSLQNYNTDCHRTLFTVIIYGSYNKLVFVPGKPFQPSLMFAGKAGAEHLKGVPGTNTLAYYKNYGCKKFYRIGPRLTKAVNLSRRKSSKKSSPSFPRTGRAPSRTWGDIHNTFVSFVT